MSSAVFQRSDWNRHRSREKKCSSQFQCLYLITLRKALERHLIGWNKQPDLAISSTVSETLCGPKRLGRELLMTWLQTKIKRRLPFISCDIKLMQCCRDGVEPKHWLCAPFEHTKNQNLNSELSSEIYGHFLLVCWR